MDPSGLPTQEQQFVIGAPLASDNGVGQGALGAANHSTAKPEIMGGLKGFYTTALEREGRRVTIAETETANPIEALQAGKVDLTYGCLGELVERLDGHKAQLLRTLYKDDPDKDLSKWRNIMHSTLTSLLPGDVDISDSGIAVGCSDDALPQNIVAVFRKSSMDRADRKAVNDVAGGVSEEMLAHKPDH